MVGVEHTVVAAHTTQGPSQHLVGSQLSNIGMDSSSKGWEGLAWADSPSNSSSRRSSRSSRSSRARIDRQMRVGVAATAAVEVETVAVSVVVAVAHVSTTEICTR